MNLITAFVFVVVPAFLSIQDVSFAQISTKCQASITSIQTCVNSVQAATKYEKFNALLMCGDEALSINQDRCTDKLALKVVDHQASAYHATAEFFSESSYSSDLVYNEECLEMVSRVLSYWVHFTSGFLTDKGCRYFKTSAVIAALSVESSKCNQMIKEFIDKLYSLTTCSNVKVEDPTDEDAKNIETVLRDYNSCLKNDSTIPQCSPQKSERLQCVERSTSNKVSNPNSKYLEMNMIDIVATSDKLFCEDINLRNDFESDKSCYTNFTTQLNEFFLDRINGFHTEEGCQGLKYVDQFSTNIFGGECHSVLQKYQDEMQKRLPCEGDQSSNGHKISVTSFLLVIVFTLMSLVS